jgi:alpha-D-ribose 1-methylphosphonate 5-triphosphate diphosphatase
MDFQCSNQFRETMHRSSTQVSSATTGYTAQENAAHNDENPTLQCAATSDQPRNQKGRLQTAMLEQESRDSSCCLSNARLVLPGEIVSGSVEIVDGTITAIDHGTTAAGDDLQQDYLVPGLVELHTDHLESHFAPRPGVRWNPLSAIQAHDAQIAASGITTVFDCLRVGRDEDDAFVPGEMLKLAEALDLATTQGRLRAEHLIHLRCEVSAPDALAEFAQFDQNPRVRLASLMDHAPGQRQFQDMEVFEKYHRRKDGRDEQTYSALVERRVRHSERYAQPHREAIAAACRARNITLASHDDANVAHIHEATGYGVSIAEFPTTYAAAEEAHQHGMQILMGAPNVVRGQSHSGNLAARDLAHNGLLNLLSSDYVPFSLLHAPFVLAMEEQAMSLPEAIKLVTSNPAATVGLDDRGEIREGLRADLIRVSYRDGVPCVRAVWKGGQRVV